MKDETKTRIDKLGLSVEDFEPNTNTMSINEKLRLIAESVTVDESNKVSTSVQTVPTYDPNTHIITYTDSGYRYGEGTATSPKQYVQGDSVEKGVYYAQYLYSPNTGKYTPQLTNGTYLCTMSGTPSKFGALTSFEKVY